MREQRVDSVSETLALFKKIDAKAGSYPTLVEFDDEHGAAIAIWAGHDLTVITAQHSLEPPYFTTRAQRPVTTEDVWFMYAGENTPYPSHSVVPKAAGVAALEHFLRTEELDSRLEWATL